MLKVKNASRKVVHVLIVVAMVLVMLTTQVSAATRTQLNSGVGQTLKMPYSTLALDMDFENQVGGLDTNYFHWCISPIDDAQGQTHIFCSRWPASLGMNGWCTNGELAHYVGSSPTGPFTYVGTVLSNSNMPSSWMVSPHNVRIKYVDNTYVIVYIMQDSRVGNQTGQKIGMLTSSSLNGPWTPVGPGGVVVSPSTDPNNWAYNGCLGVDNPDFDKINGQYYVYFKAGPAMNGTMHYGYAVSSTLTGTYTICSSPQTDNIDYLEDGNVFNWNGYEYLLTTDNFGTNTGINGANILWRADTQNAPGPFHMVNAQIGVGLLSDYTTIPSGAKYAYTSSNKFERPAILMRNGAPAYFYGADSCNFTGANETTDYVLKCNVGQTSGKTMVNDTDGTITYSGSWSASSGRGYGDYNNDVHSSMTNNDYAQYTFTGTGIDYITETNSDEGNVDVYIDGVKQTTVNCNTASRSSQQTVYSNTGLTNGSHTIKLVKTSGSYMLVDAFAVSQSAPTTINDNASGVSYSGSWSTSSGRGYGDYNDDVHYTTTNNDYCQYTFTGTGISYITETNSDEGNVDVYIDGTKVTTVSCSSSTRAAQQAVYSKTGLASGSHTIKLVKTSGSYMLVDAFTVTP